MKNTLFDSRRMQGQALRRVTAIARVLVIVLLLGSLFGANTGNVSAVGTTYYVDKTNASCSNASSNPGTTPAAPFCTIFEGSFRAKNPGDTVVVLAGTYAETLFLANSGTEGSPITFRANPGVVMTGNGNSAFQFNSRSYIVIDGFTVRNTKGHGIYAINSNHISFINNRVSFAEDPAAPETHYQGIVLRATTDSLIANNVTDHNSCSGIRLIAGSNNNVVRNNVSFANVSLERQDAAGIDVLGSSNNVLAHNILYGNEDSGVSVYADAETASSNNIIAGSLIYGNGDHGVDFNNSPYNTVVSNTIHGNGTVGLNFEGIADKGSHHGTAVNNIIVKNGYTPPSGASAGNLRVDRYSIDGAMLDYNIYDIGSAPVNILWNGTAYTTLAAFRAVVPAQEAHGLEGDPLFVAPINPVLRSDANPFLGGTISGNYRLKAGSIAIDSANSDAPSQPTNDLDNHPRADDPDTDNTGAGTRAFDDRGAYEFWIYRPLYLPIITN